MPTQTLLILLEGGTAYTLTEQANALDLIVSKENIKHGKGNLTDN